MLRGLSDKGSRVDSMSDATWDQPSPGVVLPGCTALEMLSAAYHCELSQLKLRVELPKQCLLSMLVMFNCWT